MRSMTGFGKADGQYADKIYFSVEISSVNRKQLEQLIKSGAFDSIEKNRAMLFVNIDNILKNIFAKVSASSQAL